jgi:ATP-binding cassette subfamily B (MDR/TAP) protein 9
VLCGFISLSVAAATGVFIPHYTGVIIDCIGNGTTCPDFNVNMLMLLAVCCAQAVFTGARGFCFSIGIARLKVRLQEMVFRSIVMQEQAFFDTSSTGELISRLSSDTTKVGDQVSLNINIFLRSLIAAGGSLAFMFSLSWRLTIVTFCILPATVILSNVYGEWIQMLATRAQTRMAECNKKAQNCLSSIATVRSFAAEQSEADACVELRQRCDCECLVVLMVLVFQVLRCAQRVLFGEHEGSQGLRHVRARSARAFRACIFVTSGACTPAQPPS